MAERAAERAGPRSYSRPGDGTTAAKRGASTREKDTNLCREIWEQLSVNTVCTETPARIEISVSDTRIGIPTTFLPRLYEPFSTTKVAGLGLDLYVCRTIIEQHDGCIAVDSGPELRPR